MGQMAPISWMGRVSHFEKIATALPKEGTTSFLATTLTQSDEDIAKRSNAGRRFMERNETGAEMLGFHLEGPFIHPGQAGAQPVEYIRKPSYHFWKNGLAKISTI